MKDDTDALRRLMVGADVPGADLAEAQASGEETWTTEEMLARFTVTAFEAPFVVVRRKSDGKTGTLEFRHQPRVYFGWVEA